MKNIDLHTRCAGIAIAATLALGTTPLSAQIVDTSAASTSPEPSIVLPTDPVPLQSAPIATPTVAVPIEPTVVEPVQAPREASVATTSSAPVPSAAKVQPRVEAPAPETPAVQSSAQPMNDEPVATDAAPIIPAAQPASDTVEPSIVERVDHSELLAQILAGVAGLSLLLIGLMALRRRRRSDDEVAEKAPLPLVGESTLHDPLPAEPIGAEHQTFADAQRKVSVSGAVPHEGAAVALPREAPSDPVEREALLRKMTEARPDLANPFRSPKARRRRARLILQSLSRKFENSTPRIDLSQYTSNWPALARKRPIAA